MVTSLVLGDGLSERGTRARAFGSPRLLCIAHELKYGVGPRGIDDQQSVSNCVCSKRRRVGAREELLYRGVVEIE